MESFWKVAAVGIWTANLIAWSPRLIWSMLNETGNVGRLVDYFVVVVGATGLAASIYGLTAG